jgi:hypothetical protein
MHTQIHQEGDADYKNIALYTYIHTYIYLCIYIYIYIYIYLHTHAGSPRCPASTVTQTGSTMPT